MGIFSLYEGKYKIISIVGMAKNAGKTVTLNHLIETMSAKDVAIGLTSIGRDGERQDIVTKTDKPMIYVPKGTLIATAEMLFHLSEVKMAVLEVTPYDTAMGKVVIGRTLDDGFVQIGGPATNTQVRSVAEKMLAYGASYVLVDGALDRTSSASPAITDACILSTGAVLSRDLYKTVSLTAHKASLFKLSDVLPEHVKLAFEEAEEQRCVWVGDETRFKALEEFTTALGAGRAIAQHLDESTRYVLFPGALVFSTLNDIVQMTPHYKNIVFIAGDATRLFIEEKDWLYLKRIGVNIKVRYGMALLAITLNPYAPAGYSYDSALFSETLKAKVAPVPVFNVFEGE